MKIFFFINSKRNAYLISVRAGCFILLFSIPLSNTLANELVQYRSKVFSEILNALSDKDKELAEQLVDIRLEQEKKLGILPSSKLIKVQEEQINSVPSDSKSFESQESVTAIHSINSYSTDGTKDFYASIGTRYIVGYSFGKTDSIGIRVEASGSSKTDVNKVADGSTYDFYQKNTSLGTYMDWYPFGSVFRLTSGINVNDMRTRLNGVTKSTVRINGSQVSLGVNTFNIEFKFPVVTPYVGFGFIDRKVESLGFGYFGDVGLMLGKYNAKATTSIIGVQNVTSSDVDTELSNLRKSLFKFSFVPIANFGLTYRYQ